MNNAGSCWQIIFAAQETTPPLLEEFLEEYFEVVACDYNDDGQEIPIGYTSKDFDSRDFKKQAAARGIELPEFCKKLLTSENWLKDNVIEFAPVEVEDFLVYGIHEKQAPKTAKLPIKIYAATAFGSEHQTTKSCLKAICELNRMKAPHANILDVGCGSGILSLGAAKLWGAETKITAVDIDQEAVWVTRQNALDNNVSDFVTAEVSNGYQAEIVQKNAPYDIIFANILARPLIDMAPDLAAALKPGGYAVLSGFINDQEDWVVNAHTNQGLKLVKIYELDNWRAALMEKPQ
ncbi:MAG: 50S ribosomal protein L11 methyltransferase [Alphaproteobacteria bacterium]|nr:50S ribosomal protein L11 methyltransferase [Alphaproteobacteria bacterium]